MCGKLESVQESVAFVRFGWHALLPVAWCYAKDKQRPLKGELNEIIRSIEKIWLIWIFVCFLSSVLLRASSVDESDLGERIWFITMPHKPKTT